MRSLAKIPHFWPSQRLKKVLLTAQGCARLRTGLIITQIPRGYQTKKFIVLKSAICAIICEKTPFLAFPEAKKGVVDCARLRKAAQGCSRLRRGPIIMQIPRGYQKKKFIVYKVGDFFHKVGISVLRGLGWVPQKSAGFGATAPAQKHPRSRCGTKKHSIWHYFYRIWRY